jgi:hypothetical protein
MIIIENIFKKRDAEALTGFLWLRIGTGGGVECGNEPWGSIKLGELLN